MTKYAIISDIHGNLEALEAVLDHIEADKIFCLGDVVGYGANPNECVDLIRENEIPCIKGNHDAGVTGELSLKYFSYSAFEALQWTRKEMTDENKEWLRDLDYVKKNRNLIFVHGSLHKPEEFKYVMEGRDVKKLYNAEFGEWNICFLGHTHVPRVTRIIDNENVSTSTDIIYFKKKDLENKLDLRGYKYVVNPGSVGQPRDRDWRSSYMTYDSKTKKLVNHRLEYSLAKAQWKIFRTGVPANLSKRLEKGE